MSAVPISQEPALPPPPGITPNFINPPSQSYWCNVTIGVCVPLTTVFFFLRCYVRIWHKRLWTLEDWLVLLSWIGTVAFCALMATTMAHHGGEHLWDITVPQASQVSYWFSVTAIEYAFAICITKISILWLYRRAFSHRKGSKFEITVFVFIGILICFYGGTGLAKIFECTPRAKIYDSTIPGTCIDFYGVLIADGVFNTISDFAILFMPSVAIYRLQMSSKRKLIILLIFTFGLCAPVFSIIGLYVRVTLGPSPDVSWNLPSILLWAAAEVTTGTLCVCFPVLGVLFNHERRPSKGPTTSIRNGAMSGRSGTRERSRRHGGSNRQMSANALELGSVNPYVELGEERLHSSKASSVPSWKQFEAPQHGTVRVQYDFHVDSNVH